MTILTKLGSIGESPDFVAFMAHSCFAFAAISFAHTHLSVAVIVSIVLAAVKEFVFDLKYETTPPQTVKDSALDFAGYLVGIVVAWGFWRVGW